DAARPHRREVLLLVGEGVEEPERQSAVEDGLEVAFDVVFVDALGQRQLLDEEITRRVKHLALAEAKVLVELEQVEVAQHFGDLLVLDAHDLADALTRVDGFVADLESLHEQAFSTIGTVRQGWRLTAITGGV